MADDTPNSILTAAQRDFLKKSEEERKTDYSRQSRSHHRREIAKRTRQAFHDFALLYEVLDELERNRIFDIGPLHDNVDEHNEFQDALASTVAFLYRSLEGEPATLAGLAEGGREPQSFRVPFERVLTEGLKRGAADRYNQDHATKHRIKVDYGGVELVEGGDPAALERGLQKLADRKHHELTEAEMSGILYHYEPDGPLDMLDGGYNRLNERVKELREQSNDGDDSPDE